MQSEDSKPAYPFEEEKRPLEPPGESPPTWADSPAEIVALVGSLAHEIKNPLSTIRLNMDLVAEDLEGGTSPKERRMAAKVATVRRECQRLQTLLQDFLNYARLKTFKFQPASLNSVAERALELFRPQFAAQRIEVREYLDPDLPTTLLDEEQLHGALVNLMVNAIQAMPDGGQLLMRTRPIAGGVALDVIDTGVGMDPATLGRAFEAFYSTKPGGSGLGLPMTRKIVEAHGGRIALASTRGVGTQFTLEFPELRKLADPRETPHTS